VDEGSPSVHPVVGGGAIVGLFLVLEESNDLVGTHVRQQICVLIPNSTEEVDRMKIAIRAHKR
jgi:hypothetical protein